MKKLVPIVFLFGLTVTQAQEAAPWPPDPADIFAPGVEVVSVEVERPFWDNMSRPIYVYDQEKGEWNSYPFPVEIMQIQYLIEQGRLDGQLVVYQKDLPGADNAWLFNPETGEFQRYPRLCNENSIFGLWVFVREPNEQYSSLCNTEDGTLSSALASEVDFDLRSFAGRIEVSPDRRWVVFSGRDRTNLSIRFYVYEVATGDISELGSDTGQTFEGIEWVDNNRVVISNGGTASWESSRYYIADITQPNSMTPFGGRYTKRYDNPFYYEWIEGNCMLINFFPDTGESRQYPLELDFCTASLNINDSGGDRLYQTVNYNENSIPVTVTLTRYNPYTGERSDLLTEEIERVMEISPDGNYLVLVLDSNEIVDTALDADAFNIYDDLNKERLGFPVLAVYDVSRMEIVYKENTEWFWIPDYWHYWYNPGTSMILNTALDNVGGPLSNIVALDNHYLVKKELPHVCDDPCQDNLISLTGEQVTETSVNGNIEAYLSGSGQLLIRDNENRYWIYKIDDGTTKSLFENSYRQRGYQVNIEGVVDGDMLSILVNDTVRFTIRIPQD